MTEIMISDWNNDQWLKLWSVTEIMISDWNNENVKMQWWKCKNAIMKKWKCNNENVRMQLWKCKNALLCHYMDYIAHDTWQMQYITPG